MRYARVIEYENAISLAMRTSFQPASQFIINFIPLISCNIIRLKIFLLTNNEPFTSFFLFFFLHFLIPHHHYHLCDIKSYTKKYVWMQRIAFSFFFFVSLQHSEIKRLRADVRIAQIFKLRNLLDVDRFLFVVVSKNFFCKNLHFFLHEFDQKL